MEIRQIEAFLAVIQEGSFTAAAEQLNLTQPSLSARIQQLEQSLGGELFFRGQRPLAVTPLGELFRDYAERALAILQAGREAVQLVRQGQVGRVTVCCPFSLAASLMPEVVKQFGQAYPQAELYLETGHSDFAVHQLLDGVVNIALAAAFPRYASQVQTVLRLHDEMVVAVSPAHELVGETAVTLAQLWHYQPIIIHWGQAFDAYLASLRQMSGAEGPAVRVPLAAALPMAHQPHTITFLPRRVTAVFGLVELPVSRFQFGWDAIVATRPGRTLTALEQAFVDLVTAVWHQSPT
ncbi:MAG: LysR family transcriptional regulator [Anaerolineaceae bacterium]|nr:LysR family transcriptional regulator [Anaerolineaceae bacterium]